MLYSLIQRLRLRPTLKPNYCENRLFVRKNYTKLPIQRENIMIGDVKTALDRYLTHSLTRTLDRQSSDFFPSC